MRAGTHKLADDYRYFWHLDKPVCVGWADVASFALDVGPRPSPKHYLGTITDGAPACGQCSDCLTAGTPRNVVWTEGRPSRRPLVWFEGTYVTEREAAARLGISPQAMNQRITAGAPADAPKGHRFRKPGPKPKPCGDPR